MSPGSRTPTVNRGPSANRVFGNSIGRTPLPSRSPQLTGPRGNASPSRGGFAISPRQPEQFLTAFEERRLLGPNRLLESEVQHAAWLTWPFWTDHVAWVLLGSALVINLLLFGFLSVRFPGLDLQLPLHFNSLGEVDRIGGRMELFALPIIGLIILGTNLILGLALYRWERAGAYLLWGAASAAQILFWLATFSLLT